MGAPKQPSTTTQIQKVELPAWVDSASQQNYQSAVDLSKTPYQGYEGPRVAGLTPSEQAASGTLAQGMDLSNSALQTALKSANGISGFQAPTVSAGTITPGTVSTGTVTPMMVNGPTGVSDVRAQGFLDRDINAYMNPYTQSVIDPTLASLDRSISQGQQGIADQARGSGAWGGSRFGVQQAVYQSEGDRAKAATEGNLRSAAFTDAAGRITTDNMSALQAALANQQSGLTTQGRQLQAAQGNQSASLSAQTTNASNGLQASLANASNGLAAQTANVGNSLTAQTANQNTALQSALAKLQGGQLALSTAQTGSDTAGRNALLQSQLGGVERAQQQAQLDTNYQSFLEQRDYPTEQLNMRLAALGMSPYGKTSTSTQTQTGGSGGSSGLLTGIGAAATILPLLFGSDRKIKKDVKKLGKVPGTDLNAYEYKYKKGFMGHEGPKQVGLMAQDVEKKVPEAVHTVTNDNGKSTFKAVDYNLAILNGKKRKGRSDKGHLRAPYRPAIGGAKMGAR